MSCQGKSGETRSEDGFSGIAPTDAVLSQRQYFLCAVALLASNAMIAMSFKVSDFASLQSFEYFVANWLYMVAPQLLALAIAAFSKSARRWFLVPALTSSALLLIAFKVWVVYFVPPRESGLAWIFYIPLWVVLLMIVGVVAVLQQRSALGRLARD